MVIGGFLVVFFLVFFVVFEGFLPTNSHFTLHVIYFCN